MYHIKLNRFLLIILLQIYQVDTRTDQEKADDLIQEYLAEMELPSTSDLCKEIQMRRNSLEDNELVTTISAMEIEVYIFE